jgi:hypothetical protein
MAGLYESLFGPPAGSANAYVADNYPTEGMHPFHQPAFQRFYTPYGAPVPPGGREPSPGEIAYEGAPSMNKMLPFLMQLMQERGK